MPRRMLPPARRFFQSAWNAGHPYAPRTIDCIAFRAETQRERIEVAEIGTGGLVGFVALYEPEGLSPTIFTSIRRIRAVESARRFSGAP